MHWLVFFVAFSTFFGSQIRLGNEILTVEIADTPTMIAQGLMGRTELPEGHGMLFIYNTTERRCFWMKNTLIPLSVAFFDDDRSCINILDMDPPVGNQFIKYRSTAPARYALEVPQGWFEKHGIQRGSKFSFLDPPNGVK